LVEILVVVAIVALGTLCASTLPLGDQAGRRAATVAALVGLLDRAHAVAAGDGATLQVAPDPNGPGSIVTVSDAFLGGTVVASARTGEPVGAWCSGPACAGGAVAGSFALRVRRDGSFDCDLGAGPVGALAVTIGIAGARGLTDAFAIDTSDLHAPFVERT
jgi:hypothetical protein